MNVFYFCIMSAVSFSFFQEAFAQTYVTQQISENPKIFVISNFLSEEECDYVISYAKPQLSRSTVFDEKTNQRRIDSGRTSRNMHFPDQHEDKIMQQIEKRISEVASLPESQGENIQVTHYEIGTQYYPHYDYFKNTASQEGGQRIATFIVYLNTPVKGGETEFPCTKTSINAIKGNALFFWNVDTNGVANPSTLHAGKPVIEGEKWIMTRWFREKNLR